MDKSIDEGYELMQKLASNQASTIDVFIIHRLFTLIPLVLIIDLGSFGSFLVNLMCLELLSCFAGFDTD